MRKEREVNSLEGSKRSGRPRLWKARDLDRSRWQKRLPRKCFRSLCLATQDSGPERQHLTGQSIDISFPSRRYLNRPLNKTIPKKGRVILLNEIQVDKNHRHPLVICNQTSSPTLLPYNGVPHCSLHTSPPLSAPRKGALPCSFSPRLSRWPTV